MENNSLKIDDLLTIPEAAEVKNVSRQAIYKAINCGRLHTINRLRQRLLKREEVEAYQPVGHRPKLMLENARDEDK